MGAKLTQDRIDKIWSMTEQRCTQADIARVVGCSIGTVKAYQKIQRLPASNRHGDGNTGVNAIPPVFKKESEEQIEPDTKPNEWVALEDKTISLLGLKTNYRYIVRMHGDIIKIETGYNEEPFEIDIKDLVAFGNELLDVADSITKMKKNVWQI